MLARAELLTLLVSLSAMQDAPLIEQDSVLGAGVCEPQEREAVRAVARTVDALLHTCNYRRSPEFATQVAGKSPEYVRMKLKLADEPTKRAAFHSRLRDALASLLSSNEAYGLITPEYHPELDEIRRTMNGLRNPERE